MYPPFRTINNSDLIMYTLFFVNVTDEYLACPNTMNGGWCIYVAKYFKELLIVARNNIYPTSKFITVIYYNHYLGNMKKSRL